MIEVAALGLFIRRCDAPMAAGDVVMGHKHNFDHMTYVPRGAFEVLVLKPTAMHISGWPAETEVARRAIVRATDDQNWIHIARGEFHLLRALEDGSFYHCIYAYREPQAITLDPGGQPMPQVFKRDERGQLWVAVDESVVRDSTGWPEALS